jgi:hypothetical protein
VLPPADGTRTPQPEEIRNTHDLTDGGQYVIRTKAWQHYQEQHNTGLTAQDVPGIGNCFYECFLANPQVPSTRQMRTFKEVKNLILEFVKRPSTRQSLLAGSYSDIHGFTTLTTADYDSLIAHLQRDGHPAEDLNIRIAALALKVNIRVDDITRPQETGQTFHGANPTEAANLSTILLLIRHDKVHPIYDRDFNVVTKADGHFWKVVHNPSPVAGNDTGSVENRP